MSLKEPKTTVVEVSKEELIPKFFTVIEEALKKERGTFIFCNPEIVKEFERRSHEYFDGEYQVWLDSKFGGGYHYYTDDDFEGYRDRIDVYDGPINISKRIYSVVFVKNATNCYQIEYVSTSKVGYAHYDEALNEILIINYKA